MTFGSLGARFRIACKALALAALTTCGPSDDCQVPDESCASEPTFFRVCIEGSSGHVPCSGGGNWYDERECEGIDPACKPKGERDHECTERRKPERCKSELRTLLEGERGLVLSRVLDLDADRRPDLLFSCFRERDCGLWWAKQQDDGAFAEPVALVDPRAGRRDVSIAIGELNGDGFIDLVAYAPAGSLELRLGAAGHFEPVIMQAIEAELRMAGLHDLDADGSSELLLASSSQLRVYAYAQGTLRERTRLDIELDRDEHETIGRIQVADFTGAGEPDLLVRISAAAESIQVFRRDGDGYVRAPERDAWFSGYGDLIDIDGDGASDVLQLTGRGETRPVVAVSLSNHDGTFTVKESAKLPHHGSALTGDVDGDRKLDVVSVHDNSRLTLLLGAEGGQLQAPRTFERGAKPLGNALLVDLDGDEAADLVESNSLALEPSLVRVLPRACL